ncbi:MAG: four helix bundle protein [Pyrinomonadaceae bacterium]|nr:four helix bundle protein [Sphingobacteriaceae bacterium]
MGSFKDLAIYQKSFQLAMEIFHISKTFPKEETYSLTDQIRRSSRSTNICFVEAYRKRRYPNHFISKLTDSDMENSETQGWLAFARSCNYIPEEQYEKLLLLSEEVGRITSYMINNPEKFGK